MLTVKEGEAGMIDKERLIKAWGIFQKSNPYEICEGREFRAIKEPEYCMGQMISDTIALLKEQPEVVRCKDCKHGNLYCTEDVCGEMLIECNRPDLGDVIEIHGWKWFCADGEIRY